MTEFAVLPQKVVDTKTVVLKSRLDSRAARRQGEHLKRDLFRSLGFLKPRAEDIQLIGFEKCYEPYLIIGGIYSIDYCRQHFCNVNVGENTREIYVGGKKFVSEPSNEGDSSTRIVKLVGEEVVHYARDTYFVLDRFRREVSPETFAFAPYDEEIANPKDANVSFRKFDDSREVDIEFLRAKIAKRPGDVAAVMREIFEIRDRTIVHRPVYELTYQNLKTAKEIVLQIEGVSGKTVLFRLYRRNTSILSEEPVATFREDFSTDQLASSQREPEQPIMDKSVNELKDAEPELSRTDIGQPSDDSLPEIKEKPDFPAEVQNEVFAVGDTVTMATGDLQIPSGTDVNELIVVKGTLKIGDKCRMSKKLKALGDIIVGSETVIEDGLVSGGNVVIGVDSVVRGSIKAAGKIEFKANVTKEEVSTENSSTAEEPVDLELVANTERDQSVVSRDE